MFKNLGLEDGGEERAHTKSTHTFALGWPWSNVSFLITDLYLWIFSLTEQLNGLNCQ